MSESTPAPATGRERRQHPRRSVTWPVTLELAEGSLEARLRDISEAGVCFHVDRAVPEMTLLSVEFQLPLQDETVLVRGTGAVVRCIPLSPLVDHYEVAVFFNSLGDDIREHLRRYAAETHE